MRAHQREALRVNGSTGPTCSTPRRIRTLDPRRTWLGLRLSLLAHRCRRDRPMSSPKAVDDRHRQCSSRSRRRQVRSWGRGPRRTPRPQAHAARSLKPRKRPRPSGPDCGHDCVPAASVHRSVPIRRATFGGNPATRAYTGLRAWRPTMPERWSMAPGIGCGTRRIQCRIRALSGWVKVTNLRLRAGSVTVPSGSWRLLEWPPGVG